MGASAGIQRRVLADGVKLGKRGEGEKDSPALLWHVLWVEDGEDCERSEEE